ncbi:MAG: polysaccharide export protein [Endozoicomonadaceae bacterium]|nr:polysaccharide export protein [Endozoicomonadaceae bacterium]
MQEKCKWFLVVLGILSLLQTANAESEEYKINSGDRLEISVWNEEELMRELQVLPDGSISFPLAGSLSVSGKTVKQVQKELAEKLSDFIADPVVNLSVKTVDGNIVFVLGQVKNPGRFIMHKTMDVMQILSLAGGLTAFAKANDISILRRDASGTKSIKFEYGEIEDGDDLEKNHLLQSGDVIIVP